MQYMDFYNKSLCRPRAGVAKILLVMRLIIVLLTTAILQVSASSYGQRISLSERNTSLELVLKKIKQQTGYDILYNDKALAGAREVNIKLTNVVLEEALNKLLENQPLSFEIDEKTILIKKKESPLGEKQAERVSNIDVSGRVVDADGQGLPGATIKVKGTNLAVKCDVNGAFVLKDIAEKELLIVSYIGYENKEIIASRNMIIVLAKSNIKLDEMVVVGYGTQKKVNLTGAVSTVTSADIVNRSNTNMLTLIQGVVPGVTVISRPDQTPSINFRGRGNLGTSAPLFVIDGVIADATVFSSLDANIIESVSFLKDAASASIYGSRAAYGVVLVTTKTGVAGKINVSYNALVGFKSPTYVPDMVNSWEYADLFNEGQINQNKPAYYSAEQIQWFKDGSKPDYYPNSRWYDLILDKSVPTTQHSVTFSGGTDKIRYFTDLGYVFDDMFQSSQSSKRYNLNTKLSADVTKWLTLNTNITYIRTQADQTGGVVPNSFMQSVPSILVAQQSNGEWGSISGGVAASTTSILRNPLRLLNRNDWANNNAANSIFDLGFTVKPLKGLAINGKVAFRGTETKGKSYTALQDNVKNFETGNEIAGTGTYTNQLSQVWGSTVRMLYNADAKYDWTVKKHSFSVLAGASYETTNYEGLSASRKNFPTDQTIDLNAGSSAGTDITNGGGMYQLKLGSYFGRFNYSFMDRYLFEANIRTDASSNFQKDYRWGVFPSFSAGWRVSEEEFMKQVPWIDNLKIRGSYGTLGNINNVGYYDYFQNYNTSLGYNFNDQVVTGITESKPANLKLSWEKVAMTDIGLDLDLLNQKLSLTADYYIKNTSNILLGYNVPVEIGVTSKPSQNIGEVRNKGFEWSLRYKNNINDFNYSIGANMAINKNSIIDLGASDNMIYGGGDKINYIYRVGEAIGSFYGYRTDGLYTQAEIDEGKYYTSGRKPSAGDIKYLPADPNKPFGTAITGDDRAIISTDVPKMTYGINISIKYKNFDLMAFGQGIQGATVAFETDAIEAFGIGSNPRTFHLQRWTIADPDPNAVFPRIYGGSSRDDYNKIFSQYSLFDADYFRIKNLTVGYSLPTAIINRLGLSKLRIFVNLDNMFTFRAEQRMKDFDPETSGGRTIGIGTKTYSFGLSLNLK
jgi:TonB-linked SusC/RagA family outer membrane protein